MTKTRFLTESAIIASIYAALTVALGPLGSGLFQVRISEALTILPVFTPAAIPGLFIGCIIANVFVGNGPIDIWLGSLTTLIAAFLTYKMPKRWLAPLPPVVLNAVVVGFILNYVIQAPLIAAMGFVALGQLIACYGLGYPLMLQLDRIKDRIFKHTAS